MGILNILVENQWRRAGDAVCVCVCGACPTSCLYQETLFTVEGYACEADYRLGSGRVIYLVCTVLMARPRNDGAYGNLFVINLGNRETQSTS